MFDFADAIKSVGEAFTSLFNYCTTAKEVQSETQVIKDKKRLKKASRIYKYSNWQAKNRNPARRFKNSIAVI